MYVVVLLLCRRKELITSWKKAVQRTFDWEVSEAFYSEWDETRVTMGFTSHTDVSIYLIDR